MNTLTLTATGLHGDGTSNGFLLLVTGHLLAAAAVVAGGGFAWHLINVFLGSDQSSRGDGRFAPGGGRHGWTHTSETPKNLMHAAIAFALVEGLLAAVWVIIKAATTVAAGLGG